MLLIVNELAVIRDWLDFEGILMCLNRIVTLNKQKEKILCDSRLQITNR